ncbi:MAG TPA: Gmad2 immunoglobulin-like domain-containing protein [Anaerolineales bacterium]|nr:Gmad2 immunoglobulin-like domain-containing protein [Anaerolineales bacterium]
MKRLFFALMILTLAMACSPQPAPSSVPTLTGSPVPSVPPLTVDEVMDAQVSSTTLTDQPLTYQLKDGKYQKGSLGGPDYADISLLEPMAFADLNGDNASDAVAFLAENYGGSGTFVSLVVFLNQAGKAVQAAIQPIDDRAMINSVSVTDSVIALDATIHGTQDPMCCPSLKTMRHYRLENGKLVMLDFSTQTADRQWRSIKLTAPQQGAEVSGSVHVTGNITIAPFENTLAYQIFDATDTELANGPISVTASDMGAPGTFDATIDLSSIPAGANIRIEIQDQSAADGSLLAMDSVSLVVK